MSRYPRRRDKPTHLHTPDEARIGVVHDDVFGPELLEHLVIVVPSVWSYDDEVLRREHAKVLVKVERVKVPAHRGLC